VNDDGRIYDPDGQAQPAAAPMSASALPGQPPPGTDAGEPFPGADLSPEEQAASHADLDEVAGLVYERLSARIEQRLDSAGELPSVEEAVALRERAPELYDLWLRIAQDRAATGNYVQRAPYEVPERLANSGRPRAVTSLIVVLAFCGYLAWLGGPGPYIAGLIAVLDLMVMLGLFFGLRPEQLSSSKRQGRRRLPDPPARRPLACCGQAAPKPVARVTRCGYSSPGRPASSACAWSRC
jgi:hypothetical protein